MHVDAYRLGSLAEVDDLDLDASLADAVTVVEWGEGKVEGLAEDRLEVRLERPRGEAGRRAGRRRRGRPTPRTVAVRRGRAPVGPLRAADLTG